MKFEAGKKNLNKYFFMIGYKFAGYNLLLYAFLFRLFKEMRP